MGIYIRVEQNVNLYVEDLNPGGGKTILFLHGWPANHNLFEYQFNALPAMGFRCVGVDTRGFGESDRPLSGYGYDRLADDVRRVIDTMQLSNITLAGHSMGGAIAIRYMARHGGHGVSKLALFAAAAPSFTKRPDFPYGLAKEDVTALIDQARADRPQMLQNFGDMFFFQSTTPAFMNWFMLMGLQAASWATIECAVTLRDETLFADLPTIGVPTLILQGTHDRVSLFPLAQALNRGIRDSRLVPFEFSGHGLFWEEKDKFNRELAAFAG